jgi:hypothetical protein
MQPNLLILFAALSPIYMGLFIGWMRFESRISKLEADILWLKQNSHCNHTKEVANGKEIDKPAG